MAGRAHKTDPEQAELIGCSPEGGLEARSGANPEAVAVSCSLEGISSECSSADRCRQCPGANRHARLARSRPEIGSFAEAILACAGMGDCGSYVTWGIRDGGRGI
jgi:hypothetical protein